MTPKAKNAFERLIKGVEKVVTSEKWREFLKVQAKFHNYSFNNSLMIFLQMPTATRVAGFKNWNKLGRKVKKGEKGIKILVPAKYTYFYIEDEEGNEKRVFLNQATKEQKELIKAGEIKTYSGMTFKVGHVFDISQTEGKPLPEICKPLDGEPEEAKRFFEALSKVITIPVIEEKIQGGAHGYYHIEKDVIALEVRNALSHKAKTLVHEYTHSMLDKKDSNIKQKRHEAEIVAESVAFIVADYFGLDTSSYSFEYVAAWAGADPKEILKKGNLIQKTAQKIIEQVEGKMQEDEAA